MSQKPLFQIIGLGFEKGFSALFEKTLSILQRKLPFKWLSTSHGFSNQEKIHVREMPPLDQVPNLFLPHLIPDTPLYLFIGEDLCRQSALLPYLIPLSHRMIFSSETVCSYEKLFKLLSCHPIEPIDLSWVATLGWRHLLTEIFADQETFETLVQCSTLEVIHTNEKEATLLCAWLQKKIPDRIHVTLKIGQERIHSGIQALFFTDGKHQKIDCTLCPSSHLAKVQITTDKRCGLPLTIPLYSPFKNGNLIDSLFFASTSNDYLQTLEEVS